MIRQKISVGHLLLSSGTKTYNLLRLTYVSQCQSKWQLGFMHNQSNVAEVISSTNCSSSCCHQQYASRALKLLHHARLNSTTGPETTHHVGSFGRSQVGGLLSSRSRGCKLFCCMVPRPEHHNLPHVSQEGRHRSVLADSFWHHIRHC